MTRPAAVLFDCDGVLVDTEPPACRIAHADLVERGSSLSRDEFAEIFTGSTMYAVKDRMREMGLGLPDDWVAGIYDRLYAELRQGVDLIPGIEAVLDRLDAAGIPYAVGSNGMPEKMAITLGQRPAFEARFRGHVYSGQALGKTKPDPEVYLHAARQLGVAPADCVVVDDSGFGCMAGVAAGMRTMGFAAHDDGAGLRAVGAEPFHRMADLPALLGL